MRMTQPILTASAIHTNPWLHAKVRRHGFNNASSVHDLEIFSKI